MNEDDNGIAASRGSVAVLYEDPKVVSEYLARRMRYSWQRLLHQRQVKLLNEELARRAPETVLEVAPGPGRLTVEVRFAGRGIAIENSAEMLALSEMRLRSAGLIHAWDLRAGDAFDLQAVVPHNTIDFAFTFRLIRHFKIEDRRRLYSNLRDCIRPGGTLVFDVVNSERLIKIQAATPRRPAGELEVYDASYTPEQIQKELAESGFDLITLLPLIKHFGIQSRIGHKLEDISSYVSNLLVEAIEAFPTRTPLEWVAVSQRR